MEATDNEEDSGLLGFALHSRGEGYENLQLRFKGEDYTYTSRIYTSYIFTIDFDGTVTYISPLTYHD